MGSMYSALVKERTVGSVITNRICDLDETDPYYFIVKESGNTLAEGELPQIKLKLDESYLYKKIKSFRTDRSIMVATIEF